MNVLIACEESQRVCTEFRKRGHNAYSCDIQPPSGGHPEWHIQGDVLRILEPVREAPDIFSIEFQTLDGDEHAISRWDLIIAHPPCTYLSNVATRCHSLKCTRDDAITVRTFRRLKAAEFFMRFAFIGAHGAKLCIENPCGIMSTVYRKPDQYIHPYMFAESENDTENYVTKRTGLWLYNIPPLNTGNLPSPCNALMWGVYPSSKAKTWEEQVTINRAVERSKTFSGIARAMAEQWG